MKDTIIRLLHTGIIPLVLGPPGLGKTAMAEAIAEEMNLEFRDIRLSQYMGTDIAGFPFVHEGKGKFADFGDVLFPLDTSTVPDGKDGWLVFLDELTMAEADTLKVCFSILNERRLGQNQIHPKVTFLAAGNPQGKGSLGRTLPDALINRLAVLHMDYDLPTWLTWAIENAIHPHLIAALEERPFVYSMWGVQKQGEPYVTPRSLHNVSKYLYKHGHIPKTELTALCGPLFAETYPVLNTNLTGQHRRILDTLLNTKAIQLESVMQNLLKEISEDDMRYIIAAIPGKSAHDHCVTTLETIIRMQEA